MAKPQKQATKGQKQIYEENKSTLRYYVLLSSCSLIFYLVATWLFYYDRFNLKLMIVAIMSFIIYSSAISFMQWMAKPSFSANGSLLDGGIDLNMESGMAEYAKDFIILTAICQCLSVFSPYLLLLWLAAPSYAFYLLWVNILAPWIFQPAPEDGPVNEKKQKKLERRMRRTNH